MSNATDLNLKALTKTSIFESLPTETVSQILKTEPFLPISGALNLRTISSPPQLAPHKIFRSGSLSHLPISALAALKTTYGITTIFDLRSRGEREKYPSPVMIEGLDTIWVPDMEDVKIHKEGVVEPVVRKVLSGIKPSEFLSNGGMDGHIKMYENFLQTHRDAYKKVFERLKDGDGGVLFHCSAGKDRSGVLAGLILALLNVPEEIISFDYALTRIGVEPFREHLTEVFLSHVGSGIGRDEPGIDEWCQVRGENMVAFLKAMRTTWSYGPGVEVEGFKVNEEYEGVVGYLRDELGLEIDDMRIIRERLAP